MRRVSSIWCMLLCIICSTMFCLSVQADPNTPEPNIPEPVTFEQGITISGLFPDAGQTEIAGDESISFLGRLGYRYGVFEGFIGTDDEVDIFEFGFKVFSRDVAEPGAVPLVSNTLSNFLNSETMEVRGYSGLHRVMGLGDEDFSGALVGIEQKERASPVSLNIEAQLNDNQTVLYMVGFTVKF